jgi:hypothetical protein
MPYTGTRVSTTNFVKSFCSDDVNSAHTEFLHDFGIGNKHCASLCSTRSHSIPQITLPLNLQNDVIIITKMRKSTAISLISIGFITLVYILSFDFEERNIQVSWKLENPTEEQATAYPPFLDLDDGRF